MNQLHGAPTHGQILEKTQIHPCFLFDKHGLSCWFGLVWVFLITNSHLDFPPEDTKRLFKLFLTLYIHLFLEVEHLSVKEQVVKTSMVANPKKKQSLKPPPSPMSLSERFFALVKISSLHGVTFYDDHVVVCKNCILEATDETFSCLVSFFPIFLLMQFFRSEILGASEGFLYASPDSTR